MSRAKGAQTLVHSGFGLVNTPSKTNILNPNHGGLAQIIFMFNCR